MSGALIALIQFGSAGGSSGGGSSAAIAYPSSLYAFKSTPPITTTQCQAIPIGGTPPFTYLWSQVSGDAGIVITSSTAAATTFKTFVAAGTVNGIFHCVITDSLSVAATTNSVTVTLTSNNTGGGGTNGQNTSR